ncbi:MAG: 3-deoxy-manno-octulosonate cytidylyltransferase, partial [SAR324 cluster bacterium]|nr:3-deoxy-manno-octulosonate cytidylyltransferase [SAR324 cluster bacterium]
MSVLAVIPARYASTRFPGKSLALIAGKPMIQHVCERVSCVSGIDNVLVATDDERILEAVQAVGVEALLTSPNHQTGTDRIVEAIEGRDAEWVLNVQGDEPAIDGNDLSRLIETTQATPDVQAATLVFRISDPAKIQDPNIVKAVVAPDGNALYFSRSSIPFPRKVSETPPVAWRHLGVYLFRR